MTIQEFKKQALKLVNIIFDDLDREESPDGSTITRLHLLIVSLPDEPKPEEKPNDTGKKN